MKRRTLLLAGLGGVGALVVGWVAWPLPSRLHGSRPLPTGPGEVALNGWVKIGADGAITVMLPRTEMGQGTHTGLAMLLAEELDCDWQRVRVEAAPIDRIYRNDLGLQGMLFFATDQHGAVTRLGERISGKVSQLIGVIGTGDSSSLGGLWQPMREAGAAARAVLVAIAAREWRVPATGCTVQSGQVFHPRGGTLGFGALVAKAGPELPDIDAVRLKDPAAFRLIGRPLRRLDALGKVTGLADYAGDVREPGMLFAALAFPPRRDDTLAALDDAPALAMRGVLRVLRVPGGMGCAPAVAVVADSFWRARRAAEALQPRWQRSGTPQASDASVSAALWGTVRGSDGGWAWRKQGDAREVLRGPDGEGTAPGAITAEYELPYLAHAAMEPLCCSIKHLGDRAVVHVGTQAPDVARRVVAAVLSLDEAEVEIRAAALGGGFGRRLDTDFIRQAASVAQAFPGRLVQLQWTREQDMRNDFFRPAAAARLRGAVAGGRIAAWHARAASQSHVKELLFKRTEPMRQLLSHSGSRAKEALFDATAVIPPLLPDKLAAAGALEMPYDIPALYIEHEVVELPVPIGAWRSVANSFNVFCCESFVDELAHAAGADPAAFRAAHLTRSARAATVLRLAMDKSGWTATSPAPASDGARTARGIALAGGFRSVIALVVEVSLGPDGAPRVHRAVAAIDCGIPVNPNLIRQQVEGAVIFGLSAALHGRVSFAEGRVREGNFDAYPLLRLSAAPTIEIHIVPSREPPTGVGEVGVPPVAPALTNALFALTGKRVRKLPIAAA